MSGARIYVETWFWNIFDLLGDQTNWYRTILNKEQCSFKQ